MSGPVGYQDFLHHSGTPVAVNLRPCLVFEKGINATGTLQEKKASSISYSYAVITTNAQGIAQVAYRAVAPGFPTLRFFVQENDKKPAIPFSFPITQTFVDFLAPIRVLPVDMKLQEDFISTWNGMCTATDARKRYGTRSSFQKSCRPSITCTPS